jgi:dinuclear metal center YbgI/SA1388 family protein
MTTIEAVGSFLERLAPPRLAESWDNVGLLVGDPRGAVRRAMTCLTITPATAAEAIREQADLIVAHHPLPFAAVKRLTPETTAGRLLLDLTAARVAVYSPHTAFDSAAQGINQRLAEGLRLRGIVPLVPHEEGQGTGRVGWLDEPVALGDLAPRLARFLGLKQLQIVGREEQPVRTVAVACGAAGELLDAARQAACDALVIGETRYHTCLEAEAAGIGLLLPGHYASERFAVESLAGLLSAEFPDVAVWTSRCEYDPLRWLAVS